MADEEFQGIFDSAADKELAGRHDLFRDRSIPYLAAVVHRVAMELKERGAPDVGLLDVLAEAIRQRQPISPEALAAALTVDTRISEKKLPNDAWPGHRETVREILIDEVRANWIARLQTR